MTMKGSEMTTREDGTIQRTRMHPIAGRVNERTVYGDDLAKMVSWRLAAESMWFEFAPLPDGFYRFTYKDESGSRYLDAADEIAQARRRVETIVVGCVDEIQS